MIFFITLFRYFTIVLFFTLHFFSFSQGMQTRERAHCARSVFPFIKKKKKKIICQLAALFPLVTSLTWLRYDVLEPQSCVNCWREPYVFGPGSSGQVTCGPLLPPVMVRQSFRGYAVPAVRLCVTV